MGNWEDKYVDNWVGNKVGNHATFITSHTFHSHNLSIMVSGYPCQHPTLFSRSSSLQSLSINLLIYSCISTPNTPTHMFKFLLSLYSQFTLPPPRQTEPGRQLNVAINSPVTSGLHKTQPNLWKITPQPPQPPQS